MMVIFLAVIFYLLSAVNEGLLWLLLPLTLFYDLWSVGTVGASGIKAICLIFFLKFIFGFRREKLL